MAHLTEEQLNLYLDNELLTPERAVVEAHLADCKACRSELASLEVLFLALDSLQSEALDSDLTPLVLREITSERQQGLQQRRFTWLVPAFQGVAVVLLLVFGWSALTMRYVTLARQIPMDSVYAEWSSTLEQAETLWTATLAQWRAWWGGAVVDVLSLPTALSQAAELWPELPGLGLTTPQIIAVSLTAALMWLVANSLLLRTAAFRLHPSSQPNHQ